MDTAVVEDTKTDVKDDYDMIVQQVRSEKKSGVDYKRGRIKNWRNIENENGGNPKKSITSNFNVPFPFMSGFLDTFMSKIDDPFVLKFEDEREAGYRSAMKVQAFYETEARDEDNDWESIDLFNKRYGLTYGRAITKSYPEVGGKNKYKFILENIDPYDFYDDPMGGGILENHRFMGQLNIFRSKYELMDGVESGYYNRAQVLKLLQAAPAENAASNTEEFTDKQNRLMAIGLDNKTYTYAGQSLYKLTESGTTYKGNRYLVTWNEETNIWIRCEKLGSVFESNLWPWTSWSPKPEAHNSWPVGPADDFLPVAVAMGVFLNQELDNRNKKNNGMRAYDPDMFPNPSQFEWRRDGLVAIRSGATRTRRIADGMYEFQTPDFGGTINMVEYLDNMSGTKLGITAATQGQAKEEKVGVYFGNQQSVADRVESVSKQYRRNQRAIGRRFVWAAYQYLPEPVAVRMVGENGLEWDKLRKNEINPELKIRIEGGNAQAMQDEIKSRKRTDAIARIVADPVMKGQVNPKWLTENTLKSGDIPQEEITEAMDVKNYGNRELMAEAAEAIDQLIKGQYPKINQGANTAFIKKISDFAFDNDVKPNIFDRLIAYSNAHITIAAKNAIRQANFDAIAAGGQAMQSTDEMQAQDTMKQMMGPPQGPAGNSQELSAGVTPGVTLP